MRSCTPAIQLALLFTTLGSARPSDISPFILAVQGQEMIYANNDTSPHSAAEKGTLDLFKRQNCAANYNFCSTVVTTAVCCSSDAVCSQDDAGNAACCPLGSFCTGKIPIASAASPATTTSSSNSGGAIIVITAPGSIAMTTVAGTTFTTGITPAPSYVSNVYNYPFPYIGTTFANSVACASAYSTCAAQSALCASSLQGGAPYAVSISAPGGGTTVAGQATGVSLGAVAAASVCASLSGLACPGIAGGCQNFGTAPAATAAAAGSGAHGGLSGSDWSLWAAAAVAVFTGVVGWLL